jgi:hypothetical protein
MALGAPALGYARYDCPYFTVEYPTAWEIAVIKGESITYNFQEPYTAEQLQPWGVLMHNLPISVRVSMSSVQMIINTDNSEFESSGHLNQSLRHFMETFTLKER